MAPRRLSQLASLLMLANMALAWSIVPINGSVPVNESASIELFLSNPAQVMVPFAPVAPLSPNALNLPPPGLAGQLFLATADNQLSISSKDIALISCDPSDYGGNIKASDVYGQAESSQARAVLLYSAYSDYCGIYGAPNVYNYTYTMQRNNDTLTLLNGIRSLDGRTIWAGFNTISAAAADPSSSTNSSSSAGASQDPGGPAPSTAVAMIILYSITGLITALFLGIIITGAVRAHRHPERYGPRQVAGRIRQSRARGLAKAMLDSLPIVKFGDRQEPAKPTDVELENGVPREPSPTPATDNATSHQTAERGIAGTGAEGETNHDGGIAPAAAGSRTEGSAPAPEDTQGCSICTEDFEVGQDQRVLPCDHRFHPACVDPWLLNVSGTCPLCRIDLRGESADTEEGDATAGTTAMAPPLNETNSANPADRNSRRRTVMLAIVGQFRADHMTRDERLAALRRFREQYDAQRAENSNRAPITAEATEEEESSMRRRFRRVLRITTRRPSPPTDQHTSTPTEEPQNRSTETS